MKYAFFDSNGRVKSAFNDDTVNALPEGALELDKQQFDNRFSLEFVDGILTDSPYVLDIAAAQNNVWEAIKAERDRRMQNGGYKVGTKWYHSDNSSRIQQIGLVIMADGIPLGTQWKTMNGSFITMTQALAGQIFSAAAASDIAIFAVAETHKAAMIAAPDPSAYDFSGGWPQCYLDL